MQKKGSVESRGNDLLLVYYSASLKPLFFYVLLLYCTSSGIESRLTLILDYIPHNFHPRHSTVPFENTVP